MTASYVRTLSAQPVQDQSHAVKIHNFIDFVSSKRTSATLISDALSHAQISPADLVQAHKQYPLFKTLLKALYNSSHGVKACEIITELVANEHYKRVFDSIDEELRSRQLHEGAE